MSLEETFTDKEVCANLKIDRVTSLRWREKGIIKFLKLPNGQIRYTQAHIDEFWERAKGLAALKDVDSSVKGSVINIGVAKRRHHGSVS